MQKPLKDLQHVRRLRGPDLNVRKKKLPGLYFLGPKNLRGYFGETRDIYRRLRQHRNHFNLNYYERLYPELQAAWNRDPESFEFLVVESGAELEDDQIRKQREKLYQSAFSDQLVLPLKRDVQLYGAVDNCITLSDPNVDSGEPGVYELGLDVDVVLPVYTGESNNPRERFIRHRSALGRKTHSCVALQQDVNAFGVSDLEMRILAQDLFMKPNDLLDAKKYRQAIEGVINDYRCCILGPNSTYTENWKDRQEKLAARQNAAWRQGISQSRTGTRTSSKQAPKQLKTRELSSGRSGLAIKVKCQDQTVVFPSKKEAERLLHQYAEKPPVLKSIREWCKDVNDDRITEASAEDLKSVVNEPKLKEMTKTGLLKIAARNLAYKSNGKKLVSKKRNQPVVAFGHSFPSLTVASDKLKVLYNALLSEKGATYAREKIPTFSRDCLSRRLKNTNDPSVVKPLTPLHPLRPEKDSFNSQFFSEAAKSPTKTPNDKFSDTKTSLGQLPSPPENPSFTENEVNALPKTPENPSFTENEVNALPKTPENLSFTENEVNALPKTPESELSRFVSKDNENLPSVPTSGWPNPTLSSVPNIEPVDSSSGPTEAGFASLTFVAVETIVSTETAVLACNVIVGVFTRTSVLLLALPWQVMGYSLSSLSIIINALGQRTPIFWGVISIQVYPVACCLCSNAFLCLSIPPSLFALAYLLHKKKLGCGQFVKGPDIYAYLIWGVQSVMPTLDKTLVVSPFYSTSVALFGSISLTRLHIITLRMIRWAWLLAWKTTLDAVLVSKQNSKRDFAPTHKTQMMDEKPFFKPVTSVQKPSYDVLFVFMFREDG